MKKLLLIFIGLIFSNVIQSQELTGVSVPIVTYKINTTGLSNGLIIPAPFYFHVSSISAEIDTGIGFFLQSYTYNTTDSLGLVKLTNDQIPSMSVYPVSISDIDTLTLDGMIELKIKQNLIDLYGSENVSIK